MRIIITLMLILIITSCKKEESEGIPSYIAINDIVLNHTSTHNITDAWVYINDNLQGVYELPAKFPVLPTGKHKIRIKAGIKNNGIAATRIAYPFYHSYIEEERDLLANTIISINPEVGYLQDANFFIEDFEGIGIDLETTAISDTSIIELTNGNNNYGGGILIDSLITFEIATDELDDLPQAGSPVYLEIDYKCNTQILVGMYVNFPQSVLQKDLLWINPQEEWNKIYIDLTSTVSEAVGADFFKVFIQMRRDFKTDTNSFYFDDLRIVY